MMMGSPLGEVGWGNIGYSEEDHRPQFQPQIKAKDFILSVFDINLQCNGGLVRGRGHVFSGYSWISWHGDQLVIEHPQPEKVK